MSEVGERLKSVRDATGLSLRKFARRMRQDFTLLARIEKGERYPPKRSLETFAKVLALTPEQLDALISVERRKLNPNEMLPELPPADRSQASIEDAADRILRKYRRAANGSEVEGLVPVEHAIKAACGLSTEYRDFATSDSLRGRHGSNLRGCLFPYGFEGKDRLVLVNIGRPGGERLSEAEKRITIAHEAGHYILHCTNQSSEQLCFRFTKGPTFCREVECQHKTFDLREHQATAFAASLLMPRDEFLRLRSFKDETQMAVHFGVTESLVRFRTKLLER